MTPAVRDRVRQFNGWFPTAVVTVTVSDRDPGRDWNLNTQADSELVMPVKTVTPKPEPDSSGRVSSGQQRKVHR